MQSIDTNKLVESTARKLGISKTLVKAIINDCYSGLREELKNPSSPGILLHKLGTIEVVPKALKAHIHQRSTIYSDPEKLNNYIDLLNRTIAYKNKNGKREIREYGTEDFKRS